MTRHEHLGQTPPDLPGLPSADGGGRGGQAGLHDSELPGPSARSLTDEELLKAVRKIIKTPEKWPTGSVNPSERLALAIIEFFKEDPL